MIYQFYLANYDDCEEFLSRIKQLLDAYHKGKCDFKDPYLFDVHFKDSAKKELLFINIFTSLFKKITHEF